MPMSESASIGETDLGLDEQQSEGVCIVPSGAERQSCVLVSVVEIGHMREAMD